MLNGSFVPLGEDWVCDECAGDIRATMYAFVHSRGQDNGRCICVQCITDPETDGAGDFLRAWRACSGYSVAYERPLADLVPISTGGLPPQDHSGDKRGAIQDSSLTLLQRYK